MTDERDINALRHYVARLEEDLSIADNETERLRKYSSKQALDIVTLGQEVGRLREALRTLIASCDAGRRVEKFGVSGMTVQTNIQSSWIHNVEAWAVEEARAALAEQEK